MVKRSRNEWVAAAVAGAVAVGLRAAILVWVTPIRAERAALRFLKMFVGVLARPS